MVLPIFLCVVCWPVSRPFLRIKLEQCPVPGMKIWDAYRHHISFMNAVTVSWNSGVPERLAGVKDVFLDVVAKVVCIFVVYLRSPYPCEQAEQRHLRAY